MTEKDLISDYQAFHEAVLNLSQEGKDTFWYQYLCWEFHCWAAAKLDDIVPSVCVFRDPAHNIELMEDGTFREWSTQLSSKGRYPSWEKWRQEHYK